MHWNDWEPKNRYARYCRVQLLILLPFGLFYIALAAFAARVTEDAAAAGPLIVMLVLAIIPVIAYNGYQFVYYNRVKLTNIQKVKPLGIVAGYRGRLRFRVEIVVDSRKRCFETRKYFTTWQLQEGIYETLTVGYDPRLDDIVVL